MYCVVVDAWECRRGGSHLSLREIRSQRDNVVKRTVGVHRCVSFNGVL